MSQRPVLLQALSLLPSLEKQLAETYTVHRLPPAGQLPQSGFGAGRALRLSPLREQELQGIKRLDGLQDVGASAAEQLLHKLTDGQRRHAHGIDGQHQEAAFAV